MQRRSKHYYEPLVSTQPGDFKALLSMRNRGATDARGKRVKWVKCGLLKSDSPQGKVRFGSPQHALRFMCPQLWPEVDSDSANI